MHVRRLERSDRELWRPLWDGYLRFYRADVPEHVTGATFARLTDTHDEGMLGLVAEHGGCLTGLAHLVLHPSTWSTTPYCYLEDLYVARDARGGGVAEALFEATYREADARGAARVYWHTQEYNAPARSLYDRVGHRTSFVVYER